MGRGKCKWVGASKNNLTLKFSGSATVVRSPLLYRTYATWTAMPKHIREGSYILSKARTIPTSSRVLNSIKPDTECRALVEYGGLLGSTIGYKLNTLNLNNIYLTPEAPKARLVF